MGASPVGNVSGQVENATNRHWGSYSNDEWAEIMLGELQGYLTASKRVYDLTSLNPPGWMRAHARRAHSAAENDVTRGADTQIFVKTLTGKTISLYVEADTWFGQCQRFVASSEVVR